MDASTKHEGGNASRRAWIVVLLICVGALGLRLGAIAAVGDATGFRTAEKGQRALIWDWGYEQASISESVSEGEGFSDPFHRGTGATGWAAPAYPILVAGLLELTDGPNWSTALWLAILQGLASAATCALLFRLGRALHSERLGYAAAILWALHPMAAYLPIALVWDSTFVALGLTWFLANLAERGDDADVRSSAGLGARFGALLLVNPAPLSLVPLVAWIVGRGRALPEAAKNFGAFMSLTLAVTSPWTIRNALVLGSPNIRTNLGVEFFVGNNDEATGPFNGYLHPAYNDEEFARYVELGEVDYAKDCMGRAFDWATANPGDFALLTFERAQRFWVGPRPWEPVFLGMGNRHDRDWMGWVKWLAHALAGVCAVLGAWRFSGRASAAWIVRGTLVLFPILYYVTHVFERYRFPIEPIVTLAAAAFVLSLVNRDDEVR